MHTSARYYAGIIAALVTTIVVVFLSFLPNSSPETYWVAGFASFISCFLLTYYAIDVWIFEVIGEISQRLEAESQTGAKDKNPIKHLEKNVHVYVSKKQSEIEELKRLERFRHDFLADVAHELKTPLFAAHGFVGTLINGAKDDPAVRDRFLENASKSLEQLDELVRDLLTISQIESGEVKMKLEKIDLLCLVSEIIEQLQSKAQTKRIKIFLQATGLSQAFVLADPQRIRQVFTNLLANAVTYGHEEGRVKLKIVEKKKTFEISVSDNGLGIAQEHLPRIFERFYRIDKSRSKDSGGTGLGLAIVKHILSSHHARIMVKSRLGVGTTFFFKLRKPEYFESQLDEILNT